MGQEDLEHHLIRSMSKICMPKDLSTFDAHHMMTYPRILILRDVVYRKICDALRDFVPFVEFEKREQHPSKSVTFSKVAGFTKSNTSPWVFFTFLKLYKNDTKSRNALL